MSKFPLGFDSSFVDTDKVVPVFIEFPGHLAGHIFDITETLNPNFFESVFKFLNLVSMLVL